MKHLFGLNRDGRRELCFVAKVAKQGRHAVRVKAHPTLFLTTLKRFFDANGLVVTALGGHGVQGVSEIDNPRLERNLLTFQPIGVTPTVVSFVVVKNEREYR